MQAESIVCNGLTKIYKSQGRTVLFSSHQLVEVQKICSSVTIVDKGVTIAEGPVEQLIKSWNHGLVYKAEFSVMSQEFLHSLEQMTGVLEIRAAEGNIIRFSVLKDYDVRLILAKKAVEHGVLLLSYEEEKVSLEDLFVSLVKDGSNPE